MNKANNLLARSKQKASSAEIQAQLARKFRVKSVIRKQKEIDWKDPSNVTSTGTLSQQEWEFIEHRAIQQSTQSCPICFGYFQKDFDQVILSCGHLFHGACCRAFERFVGHGSFCAICRKSPYFRKATNVGFISRRNHAILLIQSCVRGFIERRMVRKRLREYFQSDTSTLNSSRKTKFHLKELTSISSRFLRHVNSNQSQIDSLISTMDISLKVSESLDRMCDAFKGIQKANTNIPWDLILKTALERNETIECTICMCAIEREKIVVLSCTHAFHSRCFSSLEYFCSIQGGTSPRQCPVCRSSSFEKMDWCVE